MYSLHKKSFLPVVAPLLLVPAVASWSAPDHIPDNVPEKTNNRFKNQSNGAIKSLPLTAQQVKRTGPSRVAFEKGGISLQITNPFEDAGVEVLPPPAQAPAQASWDFSAWNILAVDIENLSSEVQMRLLLEVSAGKDNAPPKRTNLGIGLNPGEKRTLRLVLPHDWQHAAPEGVPGVRTLDTTQVSKLYFTVQWPFESAKKDLVNCRITNLRLEEPLTPSAPLPSDAYLPFIDSYGQFMHSDWPQKIHSASDLRRNYEQEKRELAKTPRPQEWDQYGGWKNGPQLRATGSFRTEKYQGKWYLVDPAGRLFFSQGMDVINQGTETLKVLPGKENWFKDLPTGAKTYAASDVSMKQKYGTEDYLPEYLETVHRRLEAWGFNTIGDWSSIPLMALGKTPYTLQLTDYDYKMPRIEGSKLKFYDVFDPAYIQKMKTLIPTQAAKEPLVTKSLTDPMCIGYFIDNELNFGNRGRMTLVDDILRSPAKQVAKQEFVRVLKQKYATIERFNAAWGTTHTDWDALLASNEVPTSDGYKADAQAFFLKCVDQYFRLAHDAVKSFAPNRLYLGARFISTDAVRPALYEASKKYSDILSVNVYAHSVANFPIEKLPDMPVMVTEFHFGLRDRGMFSASLAQAGATPTDRALAYTRFVQGALVHPNIVGTHWFQFRDQPLTGRGDGEAYQIGFIDVADTPYPEMAQAARLIGENMYRYRANGKLVNSMTTLSK
jgi:hypothetical protein